MGRLIGSENAGSFGENDFIKKAKAYLDDADIIYWNRPVFGREFDVCILMPGKGILAVELKGWREENILRVENSDTLIVKTDHGAICASPQKQARGYRFAIERHIRQSIGKFPLVFQMVGLPQISRSFYRAHRLDLVTEERFTFLREDLADHASFLNKLDQALQEAGHWNRDPFEHTTMLEVRSLFEPDICLDTEPCRANPITETGSCHRHDYSRFYYLAGNDGLLSEKIEEMIQAYFQGCKLYCVFSAKAQMRQAVHALDAALTQRGLVRDRDDMQISFDEKKHTPELSENATSFTAFHCSFSLVNAPISSDTPSFSVVDGKYDSAQEELLIRLGNCSSFHAEQYFIEHAAPDKNILIRAGAGTGKTYTMVSRIGFICYSQNIPLQKMADRIVMLTFTNEAAGQMKEKLKAYFQNCYLVTFKARYFHMLSRLDDMQISTIHAYAKRLIARLGTSFGYGLDLSVTSSEWNRRRKISDLLDTYIQQKEKEYGTDYTRNLAMPVYAIRDHILDFIGKLHNQSVDIGSIRASDFGSLLSDPSHKELHELLAYVIPAAEREYADELLENNRIHLRSMMSLLNRFIHTPESRERMMDLKKDKSALQFLFVDEFQDTDDIQIETLLTLSSLLDYKLFLAGDVKQCIYRFRGATEKAFDRLRIEDDKDRWLEFSLQRNYRTDAALLDLFDRSFSAWGARADELLCYEAGKDRLIGMKNYNGRLLSKKDKFFRRLPAANEDHRIPTLFTEIERIQSRIQYEEAQGLQLSPKEKSIAVLVRENWQAEMVRTECGRLGMHIQTKAGGDLYTSQPALDMLTLANALLHFDQADYLYNLAVSNFFHLDIPKSNLLKIRGGVREDKTKAREQANYLIHFMNLMLSNTDDKDNTWEYIVAGLRTKPVLQVIRKIYSTLEPWRNYSRDPQKQHDYQLNVDLLFEQLINACNVDKLTVNTLRERLFNNIVSRVSVDSRTPSTDGTEISVQCMTIHKSKGLEYGHVILPFCSASIDLIHTSQLHVSTRKDGDGYRIGYSLNAKESGLCVQNDSYDASAEKSEKSREEMRILYVAMTRAIRSFSWIELEGKKNLSWQNLIEREI